jgi:hypothetical protein
LSRVPRHDDVPYQRLRAAAELNIHEPPVARNPINSWPTEHPFDQNLPQRARSMKSVHVE